MKAVLPISSQGFGNICLGKYYGRNGEATPEEIIEIIELMINDERLKMHGQKPKAKVTKTKKYKTMEWNQ